MVSDSSQRILELVKIIKESGFKFRTFHHSVENRKSYNVSGNILGTKEKLSWKYPTSKIDHNMTKIT